jgi:hypothetical protein
MMVPPKEWPMPIRGRGIEERKWLVKWRRSRAWSNHESAGVSEVRTEVRVRIVRHSRSWPNFPSLMIPLWPCQATSAIHMPLTLTPRWPRERTRSAHSGS